MTALPTYPERDLNRGTQLLSQLGSFWFNLFEDREMLRVHMRSNAHEDMQTHLNFLEAVATVSRLTVPVFHRENWYLLKVLESESLAIPSVYKADDLVYGSQSGTVSDRAEGFVQTYAGTDKPGIVQARLPDNLARMDFTIQNMVVLPTKVWVKGIDYDVDNDRQLIRFRDDPFSDPAVPVRDIFDDSGTRIDREFSVWVYAGDFDLDYVWIHFGYALGLRLDSSQGYKDLLNAFWDMHVLGPSRKDLQLYLAALSGAPTVINPTETVEVIRTEELDQLIVTDANVYRVPLTANVLVSVGQEVYNGDVLSDAFQIRELSGNNPDFSLLPALSLSDNYVNGGFLSELTWRDEDAAVEYAPPGEDGRAFVSLALHGFPGDVEAFWDSVHENGKADGTTLAEYLDTRTNKVGQPGPTNMPATVNSLAFLLSLMRNNLFVIRIRQASFDSDAPGVNMFRNLRDLIPPHTTYIVFIELTPPDEVVDLEQVGGEEEPGFEEEVGVFSGAGPVEDDVYEEGSSPPGAASYGDVFVTAKLVSLTCQ